MTTPTQGAMARRDFLRATVIAGAGLTIGFSLVGCAPDGTPERAAGAGGDDWQPNPYVRVNADGSVTVIAKHTEMGQGAYTGLATLVAEELDADWSRVTVEGAPADTKAYGNLAWGGVAMGTGGSTAIANSWQQYRTAGATARALLVAAAAKELGADPTTLTTANGVVTDPASGKTLAYGTLVARAATLPVPTTVALKTPEQWHLIGKEQRTPRVDRVAKTTGAATFTQDFHLDGLLVAVVAHPPRFGATVQSVDDAKAKAVPGVRHVVQVPSGVAVVADTFWAAKRGRDALTVTWDESKAFSKSSAELLAEYRALAEQPGLVGRKTGDADAVLAKGRVIEATYEVPYLAHATMEPMNCVARVTAKGCELWTGAQTQTNDQAVVANALGLKPDQVSITMLYAGGSFGRRANPAADYVLEAALIAKATGGSAPVKLVWTREDDMRAGYYRPATLHRMRAVLGADGMPVVWHDRTVGQSIIEGTAFAPMLIKDGIDATTIEGATDLPYAIPHLQVELHSPRQPVPVQWWRSVGHTHTSFAGECFIDELAAAAGQDPVAYRMALLKDAPRHLGVLKLVAEQSGWGGKVPAGRARGVAVHKSFDSYVAQVVEVSLEGRTVRVHKVWAAVDCGIVVNPDQVRAQVEGAVAYGLSAALQNAITFERGVVQQANFDRYPPLRLPQMPVVETFIVPSTEAPTGIGEPGLPPIAPAVGNALYALTKRRLRSQPFSMA